MSITSGFSRIGEGAYDIVHGLSDMTKEIQPKQLLFRTKQLLNKTEGQDSAMRLVAESGALYALATRTYDTSKQIFVTIGLARAWISFGRFWLSVNDLLSGQMYRNIKEQKTFLIISDISLLIARTISAFKWSIEVGLLKTKAFALHAAKVGNNAFFSRFATHPIATVLKRTPVADIAFLIGFSALAANNIKGIMANENVERNAWELASLAPDIALGAIGLVFKVNPYVAASFGIVAAATGIKAFFYDPQNTK